MQHNSQYIGNSLAYKNQLLTQQLLFVLETL